VAPGIIDAMPPATAEAPVADLARAFEDFLAEHPHAAVLDEGRVLFDMASARYSLSAEYGRCLLHLWSEEQNLVRSVIGVRLRKDCLRIETRRFGQARPQVLEIVPTRDRRSPSTREASRAKFQRLLERVLQRGYPGWSVEGFRTTADLEHSFGPAYARGILSRGLTSWAILAVNPQEPQPTIDGALTIGILWLAYCREHSAAGRLVRGLKIVLPAASSTTTQARIAWLNSDAAQWELYELDERSEDLARIDCGRSGNLHVKLIHAFDPHTALERTGVATEGLLMLLSPGLRAATEVRANSPTEVSFALHGLEFARIRHGYSSHSFSRSDEVTFGAGANEMPLTPETEGLFRDLTRRLFKSRHTSEGMQNPLFRLQPERWLESVLRQDIAAIEPTLRADILYTQVPAFAAGDRAMIDLLTVSRSGRLAVIEVKADDDLHLPLQALDYWSRVRQLHREGAFQKHGYFRGIELSHQPPLLYLVAPAFRIHPATDTILKHLSPEIPWEVIGVNEDWRKHVKVILRKRSATTQLTGMDSYES
jgi:hypothetical protein